jgi:hypothetical protein
MLPSLDPRRNPGRSEQQELADSTVHKAGNSTVLLRGACPLNGGRSRHGTAPVRTSTNLASIPPAQRDHHRLKQPPQSVSQYRPATFSRDMSLPRTTHNRTAQSMYVLSVHSEVWCPRSRLRRPPCAARAQPATHGGVGLSLPRRATGGPPPPVRVWCSYSPSYTRLVIITLIHITYHSRTAHRSARDARRGDTEEHSTRTRTHFPLSDNAEESEFMSY